jgi:serine/threonine protein kinase/Tfp pilus assembly protein PilF
MRSAAEPGSLVLELAGSLPPCQGAQGDKSVVVNLAYEEFCQRQEAGENPDPEEFCARFPDFQSSLRHLLGAHCFMLANHQLLQANRPVTWPEPGSEFLGYSLLQELGRGTFGRVFLATEPALGNRFVAVKVSFQGGAEARTLGRLDHPHIVPVHSIRQENGTGLTAVCMPYLGRATLCDVLDRAFAGGKRPSRASVILDAVADPSQAAAWHAGRSHAPAVLRKGSYVDGVLHIGLEIAEALAFAHQEGICHRDLKPSNVLLTPAGSPMLLDFNLSFDERHTDSIFGGTVPYMSPEQLRATDAMKLGDSALVDKRSDLFSLGIILYELLTGAHPFGPVPHQLSIAELRSLLLERHETGPRPVRGVKTRLDASVTRLLESCLAFAPADRPQSANELASLLRRALSPAQRARRAAREHLRVVCAGGVALLVVAIAVAGSLGWTYREPYSQRQWQQGALAYRQGDYVQALQALDRALGADPAARPALVMRGRTHIQLALLCSERARDAADSEEKVRLHFEKGQHLASAARDLGRANELESSGPTIALLGYCFNLQGYHAEAIYAYQTALKSGYGSAEVLNNLGYSHIQKRELVQARKHLDSAVKLNATLPAARHNRALLAYQANKVDSLALEDMQVAIHYGPPSGELFADAARICALAAPDKPDEVLQYARQAVALGESAAELLQKGRAFEELRHRADFQALLTATQGSSVRRSASRLLDPFPKELE